MAEACFLVQHLDGGQAAVLDVVQRGVLSLPFHPAEETVAVSRLLNTYRDIPMSLADARMMRVAEQHTDSVVLTSDPDFIVYRKPRHRVIPVLMPEI